MIVDRKPSRGHGPVDDADIRKSLTAELFGSLGAALPAYAAAITMAIFGVVFEHRLRDDICLVAIVLVTAIRIGLLRAYRRRPDLRSTAAQMKGWEMAYGALAGLWTLLLGIDASFLMTSSSVVVQLLGTIMAIGMTGGIAARHAPHPWIVVVQMIAILVPFTAALMLHHGLEAVGLAVMTVFMFLGVWSATRQINANLVLAMRNSAANRALNDRFDTALNNMSHGLLMFDAEQKLEVVNERFAAMFHADRARFERGQSLAEVVDIAMGHYARTLRTREDYIALFGQALRARTHIQKTLDFADGAVIDFRFEPVENGGTVLVMEDVTEKHLAAARIEHLAHYDGLTGLPNRSSFSEFLPRAIQQAGAGNPAFSLLYLDLDGFKEVNDTLGHGIGDKLLVEVAARLRARMRREDLCYRIGGDEFVLIQFAPDGADEVLALRLIDDVAKPYDIAGHEFGIGLSIGIARFGEDGDVGDELLKNADIALYKAKEAGKQTYRRFHSEMAASALDRRRCEADLRRAIEDGAIDVHFQPIVHVAAGRTVAYEALLRWFHPIRGLTPADETVKLAESIGLIIELGAIVMRKACIEAMNWPSDITVAVNLSAMQFRNAIVLEQIKRALATSGLPAHRLEVEITESVAFGNLAAVRATIEEIRAMGVKVALDDFGTGYTSLSYLSQIPFDKVKIDRSFVTKLGSDSMAASLIQLMGGLLRGLDKAMVVEGVETPEQVAILRNLGADLMQGYFFSKAKPASEIATSFGRDLGPQLRIVA